MRTAAERSQSLSALDPAAPTPLAGAPSAGEAAAPSQILQTLILQTWLSPAFPVGAFAYSHGLEWAVEDRTVHDLGSLVAWLDGVVRHGAGRSDMILLAHAWRAVDADDDAGLVSVAELAAALQPTRERRLESLAQGEAFLKAVRQTWPGDAVERVAVTLADAGQQAALPVGIGAISAAHGLALPATLAASLTAFVANLCSAAVRLVPLGQTDGQRAVAALMPLVIAVAAEAEAAALDDIGGVALRADIASALHETQYTRLFRS